MTDFTKCNTNDPVVDILKGATGTISSTTRKSDIAQKIIEVEFIGGNIEFYLSDGRLNFGDSFPVLYLIEQGNFGLDSWAPTADDINALPDKIRDYIHQLETLSDPARIVAENISLKDDRENLIALIAELRGK